MRNQIRKNIRRGLKVSIVLKADQPTGRRTVGIVQDLLTSSPTHPRGIKVRLTDGQVGRVQEILDGEAPPAETPKLAPAKEPIMAEPDAPPEGCDLALIILQGPSGSFFVRQANSYENVSAGPSSLGLRAVLAVGEEIEGAIKRRIEASVLGSYELAHLFTLERREGRSFELNVWHCFCGAVRPLESLRWVSAGWYPADQILKLEEAGRLREESREVFKAFRDSFDVAIEPKA